jgi:ABC-type multidrug transport system ATPase subunit
MNETAIELRNISKEYYNGFCLKNLSLQIQFGEVTALLGCNGAGKSTIMNLICGFLIPDSGEIFISNRSYQNQRKEILKDIGYLGQEMALYPLMSIRESYTYLSRLKGMTPKESKNRIDELVSYFEIEKYIDKKFNELSSGQKQLSLVIASILHDPSILIFDEVTASLDIVTSFRIMTFLKGLKEKGKCILFATHILSEVEHIGDKIAVLANGNLLTTTDLPGLKAYSPSNSLSQSYFNIITQTKIFKSDAAE